jgi:hypothetical protein
MQLAVTLDLHVAKVRGLSEKQDIWLTPKRSTSRGHPPNNSASSAKKTIAAYGIFCKVNGVTAKTFHSEIACAVAKPV